MEPLTALGLASNIIQIVDFTSRLISNAKEIYESTDGVLDAERRVRQAAANLSELSAELQQKIPNLEAGPPNRRSKPGLKTNQANISAADKQLLQLTKEARDLATTIADALQRTSSNGNRRWKSIKQALQAIWSRKELSTLETKLDKIRGEIDTVILVSLRNQLEAADDRAQDEASVFFLDAEKRHHELLEALSSINLQAMNAENAVHLSTQLHSLAHLDSLARFSRIVNARLRFPDMPDRLESIPEAHQKTFAWLFDRQDGESEDYPWESFADWLAVEGEHHLYWITGKPGSGKSTLMKYLYHDDRTYEHLRRWAGTTLVVHAGFFFWNSGTAMQMSRLGLLATLLYESIQQFLEQDPASDIVRRLFPDRWEHFEAFGGGRHPFKWAELLRAFNIMISDDLVRFFFAIDGLDEFDGRPEELIDFALTTAKRENVKICVASRPWLVFEDAFQNNPNLLLENLTRQDIRNYVTAKFESEQHILQLNKHEPEAAQALIDSVVDKATGVFLWVYLVVESLLRGIVNADRMSDLQRRLDDLPAELEELFHKMLNRLEPMYFRHACELFRLLSSFPSTAASVPTVLQLSFADDDDIESGIRTKAKPLQFHEQTERVEAMIRRVKSRCQGFLQVYWYDYDDSAEYGPRHRRANRTGRGIWRIRYLHRTARDYLHSKEAWALIMETTSDPTFNTDERWANGFLWSLKTTEVMSDARSLFCWCIDYALRLEKSDGQVRLNYLDEAGDVAVAWGIHISTKGLDVDIMKNPRPSFLDIAVALGLDGYVRIKERTTKSSPVGNRFAMARSIKIVSLDKPDWLEGRTALKEALESTSIPQNEPSQDRRAGSASGGQPPQRHGKLDAVKSFFRSKGKST